MSRSLTLDLLGLCGLIAGLWVLSLPFASASPGPEVCAKTCENVKYHLGGSSGACMETTHKDCSPCAIGGRCTYTFLTDVGNCKQTIILNNYTRYPDGCDTPCPYVDTDGLVEASNPVGNGVPFIQNVNLYECKN